MTLEKLQSDMINALKTNNKTKKEVLSACVAAVKKAAIDKGCRDNITEELVDTVLLKEHKTVVEQIDTCPEERADLKLVYNQRLTILNEYVPQLETDPIKIRSIIEALVAAAGIEPVKANKGAVMKSVMPELKGKVDMKIANKVIGDILV